MTENRKTNKNILLIAGQYFPFATPCAFRVHSFARHLPDFGYQPCVLALDWTKEMVAKDTYFGVGAYDPSALGQDICKVFRVPQPLKNVPLHELVKNKLAGMGSQYRIAQSYQAAIKEFWPEYQFHGIVATIPQLSNFLTAKWASRQYGVPWIADYRDVVDQYSSHRKQPLKSLLQNPKSYLLKLRGKFTKPKRALKEIALGSDAYAATTVSEGLAEYLRLRGLSRVEVIINGYEPEEYQVITPELSGKFRIVYAGALHWEQNPSLLFDALDQIVEEQDNKILHEIEIHFYGVEDAQLAPYVKGRPCRRLIKTSPRISKMKLQAIMKGAALLLHLSHQNSKGIMTSKLTEYLGAKQPIITIPGDSDVVDDFLKTTKAGVTLKTSDEIKSYISDQFKIWKKTGKTDYRRDPMIEKFYTRSEQARYLSSLIGGAIKDSERYF